MANFNLLNVYPAKGEWRLSQQLATGGAAEDDSRAICVPKCAMCALEREICAPACAMCAQECAIHALDACTIRAPAFAIRALQRAIYTHAGRPNRTQQNAIWALECAIQSAIQRPRCAIHAMEARNLRSGMRNLRTEREISALECAMHAP